MSTQQKKSRKFDRNRASCQVYKAGRRREVNKAKRLIRTLNKQPSNRSVAEALLALYQADVGSVKQACRALGMDTKDTMDKASNCEETRAKGKPRTDNPVRNKYGAGTVQRMVLRGREVLADIPHSVPLHGRYVWAMLDGVAWQLVKAGDLKEPKSDSAFAG